MELLYPIERMLALLSMFLNDESFLRAAGIVAAASAVIALWVWTTSWRFENSTLRSYDEIPRTILSHMASRQELKELSGEIDVVIVGSGIGALSSAVVLSKVGYKVVVFEQHSTVGGSTHCFKHDGFDFDVGVHYVGNMLDCSWSPFRILFDYLSDGQLEWARIDDTFDVAYNDTAGVRLEFTGDAKANRQMLLKAFPYVDPKALDKYYQKCRYARLVASITFLLKCLPPFMTRIVWSLGYQYLFRKVCLEVTLDVMRNDCGLPDDVIGAILYSYGDYGTPPSESPFFVQAFMESHYDGGAFFPKGGSTSIAKTLVAAIQRRGGKVFAAAPIESIITKKDMWGHQTAVGVCVRGVDVLSRKGVISGAGFVRTFEMGSGGAPPLVRDEQASAAQLALIHSNDLVQSPFKPSNAFFYLFVGLNGTDEELGLHAQNIWHLQRWNHDELFQEMLNTESIDEALKRKPPLIFLSNESAKDPDYNKRLPGKSTVTMVAWTNPQWFSTWSDIKHGNRGQDYEAIKAKMTKQLLEVLYLHFPKTKGKVAVTELGTPLSVNKYLGRINGEIYNLDHNVSRFDSLGAQLALHPQTTIKNLYLTGQDANFVSIEGATMSGFFTAARFSIFAFLFAYLPLVLSCIPGFIWY